MRDDEAMLTSKKSARAGAINTFALVRSFCHSASAFFLPQAPERQDRTGTCRVPFLDAKWSEIPFMDLIASSRLVTRLIIAFSSDEAISRQTSRKRHVRTYHWTVRTKSSKRGQVVWVLKSASSVGGVGLEPHCAVIFHGGNGPIFVRDDFLSIFALTQDDGNVTSHQANRMRSREK